MHSPSLALALASVGIAVLGISALTHVSKVQAGTAQRSLGSVIERYGPMVDSKLSSQFVKQGISYPPKRVALIALKHEKRLELWSTSAERWGLVKTYPVQGASGISGPKLQEGDRQVPEGFYRIVKFNPNSNYHLSLKLNYPNAYDRARADSDGRRSLGGNIFIHGRDKSIGCLAIGDRAIEELFVLVERVGLANTEVIIAPQDFRNRPFRRHAGYRPLWVPELYEALQAALNDFDKRN